jgi:pantoate--beta-alanine ligase
LSGAASAIVQSVAGIRCGDVSTERDRYLTEDWTDMDRDSDSRLFAGTTHPRRVGVVGAGRLGTTLAAALTAAGLQTEGPLGRDGTLPPDTDAVLLCVPDAQIAAAAAVLPHDRPGLLVGHCSAATTLEPLAGHEAFSLHPLMTVPESGASFAGATAAVAGATPRALATADALARMLGMRPVHVADTDRAAYHAAASIASNFLVTLEGTAERLAATAGIEREQLVALVRASVENWATAGASQALTGPIARGDEETVARQRAAVAERAPEDLELFDALVAATRRLADARHAAPPHPLAAGRPATPPHGLAAGRPSTPPQALDAVSPRERMRTLRTVSDLRSQLAAPRRAGRRIGLVPTMGALHDGHLSLIRQARATCDVVVVSLFVNPTQFDDAADLSAYPRDEARDAALAQQAGADFLFAPPADEVYPQGFATTVRVGSVSERLEGASRGSVHFDGVATVVTKLLNIVQPDVAFFGQKDAQQVAVIRRLVRDLDMPVAIEVGATVRELDGLALSSRNVRLRNGERALALALPRALDAARGAVAGGERDPTQVAATARAAMREHGVEPEYLELVAPDTFAPVRHIDGEPVLVAVAARVGDVRLIDNELLEAGTAGGSDTATSTGSP